jgi:hypothetical protein
MLLPAVSAELDDGYAGNGRGMTLSSVPQPHCSAVQFVIPESSERRGWKLVWQFAG